MAKCIEKALIQLISRTDTYGGASPPMVNYADLY